MLRNMTTASLIETPNAGLQEVMQASHCGQCARRCMASGKPVFMAKKPIYEIDAQTVINFKSAFFHKLLCDGPVFSLGSTCLYKCAFCYVIPMIQKLAAMQAVLKMIKPHGLDLRQVAVRRRQALDVLFRQLTVDKPKWVSLQKKQVVFTSPLVDPAPTMELARETAAACEMIFQLSNWDVRILSKGNLLPKVVEMVPEGFRHRLVLGVSTGTVDDGLAKAFEIGTAHVSRRLASLHQMQDAGYRTYGMLCPILPQPDYDEYAERALAAIRVDRCEHVWAEAINIRGKSLVATHKAISDGGFKEDAARVKKVFGSKAKDAWEEYARATFEALAKRVPPGKLRFLHYPQMSTLDYWAAQRSRGAIVLGKKFENIVDC